MGGDFYGGWLWEGRSKGVTAKCLRFIVMSDTSRMGFARPAQSSRTEAVIVSLHQKIQRLKESVGSRETESRTRLVSSSITLQLAASNSLHPHSPLKPRKTMRLLMQKESAIESGPQQIKDLLTALDRKELPHTVHPGRSSEKEREEDRLERLRRESELLKANTLKKQMQLAIKNESLKTLKQQLISKVQLSNTHIRTQKQPTTKQPSRPHRSKSSVPVNSSIQLAIAQQKNHQQEEEKQLKHKQREAQIMSLDLLKKLREEERERERLDQQLKIKREKVDRLKEQISSPPKVQLPDPTLQIEAIRRKKQAKIQMEKSTITQLTQALQQHVEEEEQKHTQLQQELKAKEEQLAKEMAMKLAVLQEQHSRTKAAYEQQIQQEEHRRRENEARLEQERRESQRMAEELKQWEHTERQLQEELMREEKERQRREEEERRERLKRAEREIAEWQEREMSVAEEYKKANAHLLQVLRSLKSKNEQLQTAISEKHSK